jgi:hypothetical protein
MHLPARPATSAEQEAVMTTLRHVQLTYHTPGDEHVTVRLRCAPDDPKRFVAIYRTEEEARREGAKPDCRIRLKKNNDGYIEVVERRRGEAPPMKNDPGCIRFADGSWWCPSQDEDMG